MVMTPRWIVALRIAVLASIVMIASAGPAGADPAGPTNYRTEIESIEPPSAAFDASIVGGDSFLLVEQKEPVTIEVPGYNNEPYLRYLPDGTVERNRRSPATYLNADRYGNATNSPLPPEVSADAVPEWEVVATDGVYAWHDHRAHWMLTDPPLGLGPGDQILDERIPVIVDGTPIVLVVGSFWQEPPSPIPVVIGVLVAVGASLAAWRSRGRLWPALLGGGLIALAIGVAQFVSLPAATEPSPVLWILPLIAVLCAGGAAAADRRPATSLPLVFGGSVTLVVFAVTRLESITKAILPSDLPFWLDRFGTALALVLGVAVVVMSAVELSRLLSPESTEVGSGASPAA